ncbi:hypothetical protein HW130_31600 [Streptomyces sp. PKU-EA00015]|uniref:hypothetical protein n=1 Tax=Streptomyces sp. PKU-EA00015 TaxID=2748326 RepID=UPI00159FF837|nr:hypothetical protein [Streptomyces sp. PKU-EA00015]NWF30739.1 hypothetical protein [Streptomyces sp. PKU-EA00015]
MFRRTFWFTAGAAAGVWATTKVNRKLKQLTPESLAAQAADKAIDAGHRLKDIAVDIRAQMLRREAELGEVLGLNAAPGGELPAAGRRAAIEPDRPAPVTYLHSRTKDSYRTTKDTTEASGPETSYDRNEDH